jgi:hypothetical protein
MLDVREIGQHIFDFFLIGKSAHDTKTVSDSPHCPEDWYDIPNYIMYTILAIAVALMLCVYFMG